MWLVSSALCSAWSSSLKVSGNSNWKKKDYCFYGGLNAWKGECLRYLLMQHFMLWNHTIWFRFPGSIIAQAALCLGVTVCCISTLATLAACLLQHLCLLQSYVSTLFSVKSSPSWVLYLGNICVQHTFSSKVFVMATSQLILLLLLLWSFLLSSYYSDHGAGFSFSHGVSNL